MDLAPCLSCARSFDVSSGDFHAFLAHRDACVEAQADALAAAHPEWDADLVAFFHPRRKRVGTGPPAAAPAPPPAPPAGAAAAAAPPALFSSPDCSEVVPGVFISNITAARDAAFLRARGIAAVVNCVELKETRPQSADELAAAGVTDYTCLDLDDAFHADRGYAARVDAGVAALAAARARGDGALVHCAMGVSRSATVLVAFLMEHGAAGGGGLPLADALKLARARRAAVYPNRSFVRHLRDREAAARGAASVPEGLLALMAESIVEAAGRGGRR